jgi:hypothetical protein
MCVNVAGVDTVGATPSYRIRDESCTLLDGGGRGPRRSSSGSDSSLGRWFPMKVDKDDSVTTSFNSF